MTSKDFAEELDQIQENVRRESEWKGAYYKTIAEMQAREDCKKESLRLALITNERDAGRVSKIAAEYYPFLYGKDGQGWPRRATALENACNAGYETPGATVEAAVVFDAYLSSQP